MKAAFFTLGCKTNQFETQALERLFSARGFETVPFSDNADVYIVNTCSVTALSDRKSRTAIRNAKNSSPDSCVIVCGCYSQHESEDVLRECGADIIVGTADKSRIPDLAEAYLSSLHGGAEKHTNEPLPEPQGDFDFMPSGGLASRTRALLKVQDGCRNFCAYCIIPHVRGTLRSIRSDLAASESARLESEGYREIVLTGIEISSYGLDLPGRPSLADLIDCVCVSAPKTRVRLGSLEPRTVTREWAERVSKHKNLCPHFHLSLQSGCDRTLKAMGRRYDTARYLESCGILREFFPGCAITTDLIVGFPGETEEDFAETLAFIEKFAPAQVHIFPYSRRKGTRAYSMPDQKTAAEKSARAASAAKVCSASREKYLRSLFGKTLSVLFEQEQEGVSCGHCGEYIPVYARGGNLNNEVKNVYIEGACKDGLSGRIEEK